MREDKRCCMKFIQVFKTTEILYDLCKIHYVDWIEEEEKLVGPWITKRYPKGLWVVREGK